MYRNWLAWGVALAISVFIELPTALARRQHVSHKEGVHVLAAIVVILGLTLAIRLVIFGFEWLWRHKYKSRRGQA
jgi:hypothetical protein